MHEDKLHKKANVIYKKEISEYKKAERKKEYWSNDHK